MELLLPRVAQLEAKALVDVPRRANRAAFRAALFVDPACQVERGEEAGGTGGADPGNGRHLSGQGRRDRPEPRAGSVEGELFGQGAGRGLHGAAPQEEGEQVLRRQALRPLVENQCGESMGGPAPGPPGSTPGRFHRERRRRRGMNR